MVRRRTARALDHASDRFTVLHTGSCRFSLCNPNRRNSYAPCVDCRCPQHSSRHAYYVAVPHACDPDGFDRRRYGSAGTRSIAPGCATIRCPRHGEVSRSEEHTSELQSQSNLVCRLLLEKKKAPRSARRSQCAIAPSPQLPPLFPRATPPTEIYTLSLHDALPICSACV